MIELGGGVALVVVVGWLVARATGWSELRERYPFSGRFDGPVRYWNTVRLGSVPVATLVNFGLRSDGLHLRVSRAVRVIYPFHSPMLIPYAAIEGRSYRSFPFARGVLDVEGTSIDVPIDILDRMERASEGRWRYERL